MAKKIDLSGMKEFFFNHGEKVALGTCGFIALALGLWAFLDAVSAGKPLDSPDPFAVVFKKRTDAIREQIARAPKPQVQAVNTETYNWPPYSSRHVSTPYAPLPEQGDDKRRNPQVLPIKSEPGTIRVDYIAGLTFKHEMKLLRNEQALWGLDPEGAALTNPVPPLAKKKGEVAPPVPLPSKFVHVPLAKRMIVVQAIFPMKQQVEEFRRALKMNDQSDMFTKDRYDLPQPLGIDVYRHEVPAKGEAAKEPEKLMLFEENGKLYVLPSLETFLREAIYDELSPEVLDDWIFAGLTTPMPKLGNRAYPRFTFPGFDVEWAALEEAEKNQMWPGAAAVAGQPAPQPGKRPILPGKKAPPPAFDPQKKQDAKFKTTGVTEKDVRAASLPSLAGRLWGKEKNIEKDFNIYHVLGNILSEVEAPKNPPAGGRKGKQLTESDKFFYAWDVNPPKAGEAAAPDVNTGKTAVPPPAGTPYPAWDRDALVRFIDVDVLPGKTYYYSIRVRLANPNFGKKDAVAFQALAANAELPPSAWVQTPQRTVPEEYHLYAIDQKLHDAWANGDTPPPKNTVYPPSNFNNYTPFQIHQWVEKKSDLHPLADPELFVIGDWIIAKQQYVRKGDYIGKDVVVPVPAWNKDNDKFELPQSRRDSKKGGQIYDGIHVNLTPNGKAPVLVDFTGGKRLTRLNTLEEEVAVDALVLMPDGTLKVLNSRDAADTANPDPRDRLEAKERQDRVDEAKRTIQRIKGGGSGANPNGGVPPLPGAKGSN